MKKSIIISGVTAALLSTQVIGTVLADDGVSNAAAAPKSHAAASCNPCHAMDNNDMSSTSSCNPCAASDASDDDSTSASSNASAKRAAKKSGTSFQ